MLFRSRRQGWYLLRVEQLDGPPEPQQAVGGVGVVDSSHDDGRFRVGGSVGAQAERTGRGMDSFLRGWRRLTG